ncbi:MAG: choline/ethanolamine kinase family protein [Chloroflexota bacterium]
MENIQAILARIPIWQDVPHIRYERVGGLTNANYRVTVDEQVFMLRVSRENTAHLGISRRDEYAALQAAAAAGIGPEVVAFLEPEGHLVTRWVDGRHWQAAEYRTPAHIRLMTQTVRRIHGLPVRGRPGGAITRRVAAYCDTLQRLDAPLPGRLAPFLATVGDIEADQQADRSGWQRFCHNDLASGNYLFVEAENRIVVLDWEFAGPGDVYFDLAYVVYTHDNDGPIPPDLEEVMLAAYFDEVTDFHRRRLLGMKYVRTIFNVLWGLTQDAMQRAGLIPKVAWFDYGAFAENLIAHELRDLQALYLRLAVVDKFLQEQTENHG